MREIDKLRIIRDEAYERYLWTNNRYQEALRAAREPSIAEDCKPGEPVVIPITRTK